MSTKTVSKPDLSQLPESTQFRITVMGTQGWTWERDEGTPGSHVDRPRWVFALPGGDKPFAMWDDAGIWCPTFPDPENDPAAWGALMERERISLYPAFSSEYKLPWEARWGVDDERDIDDAIAATPGRAVCLAVLAKHGIPWPGYCSASHRLADDRRRGDEAIHLCS
jgi:hypothetical protein